MRDAAAHKPDAQAKVGAVGRDGVFSAIVEPKRETALIGAIVLEDLDLLVDFARTFT